jgi:hypothetical protein
MERNRHAARQESEAAKQQVRDQLADKLARERADVEEMGRIRAELNEEEMAAQFRDRERGEMEHRIRQRLMMQKAREEDLEAKRRREEAEAAEEEVRCGKWGWGGGKFQR